MRSWFKENADYLWRQSQLAAVRTEVLLLKAGAQHEAKYDPDQPRVLAGSSGGGQWTSGAGTPRGSFGISSRFWDECAKLAAGGATMSQCVDQCLHLLLRPQAPGSDLNEFAFRRCLNRCLGVGR
jgi:hypothetical protein